MFNIVLFEPEIPQNTGSIIRLCANTGARLHLIQPLGFHLDDKLLLRAGLDYREFADVVMHDNWTVFRDEFAGHRMFTVTTRATQRHDEPRYAEGDTLVFGPETRGLPTDVLGQFEQDRRIRIPMLSEARSLNLANAAAVVVYEAWRQTRFRGGV